MVDFGLRRQYAIKTPFMLTLYHARISCPMSCTPNQIASRTTGYASLEKPKVLYPVISSLFQNADVTYWILHAMLLEPASRVSCIGTE